MSVQAIVRQGLATIANVATGGLSDRIMKLVEGILPTPLSTEKKAELQIALAREETDRQRAILSAASDTERAVTERATLMEGTAKDLAGIPIIGPAMLFLRGTQRIAWGFATIWIDAMVFSGNWRLPEEGPISMAFWSLNILVLGFLFGERTLQNVLPILSALKAKR